MQKQPKSGILSCLNVQTLCGAHFYEALSNIFKDFNNLRSKEESTRSNSYLSPPDRLVAPDPELNVALNCGYRSFGGVSNLIIFNTLCLLFGFHFIYSRYRFINNDNRRYVMSVKSCSMSSTARFRVQTCGIMGNRGCKVGQKWSFSNLWFDLLFLFLGFPLWRGNG